MRRLAGWRRHRTPSWVDTYTAHVHAYLVLDQWRKDRGFDELV